MTDNSILLKDNIKKPLKPHRVVYPHEFPTEAEILKRKEQIKKLQSLGIEVDILDGSDTEEYEEDMDKLKASILIMQDKELPKDLEERLLQKKKRADDNKKQEV